MKYRARTEITAMILESARAGATKTKIMYNAYLSYAQLLEYIKNLLESELLVYEEGKQLYRVTEKGLKYLNVSHEINELMVPTSKNYQYIENM
jgi:predicted transcriptional regulator